MTEEFSQRVEAAAAQARRAAAAFPSEASREALPWTVIAAFDADVRGFLERDPRIEDERDRVLIHAVALAEAPGAAGGGESAEEGLDPASPREAARRALIDAIDYLEQAVLRFGLPNARARRPGPARSGDPAAGAG